MEIQDLIKEASKNMEKVCLRIKTLFDSIQVNKIKRSSIEKVKVSYYDAPTELIQLASIRTLDVQTLSVELFDKKMIPHVEKVLSEKTEFHVQYKSNMGGIVVALPTVTEERRIQLVGEVKAQADNEKIQIRNQRNDIKKKMKSLQKEGLSEDELRRAEGKLQDVTNSYIGKIDDLLKVKEKDLMRL